MKVEKNVYKKHEVMDEPYIALAKELDSLEWDKLEADKNIEIALHITENDVRQKSMPAFDIEEIKAKLFDFTFTFSVIPFSDEKSRIKLTHVAEWQFDCEEAGGYMTEFLSVVKGSEKNLYITADIEQLELSCDQDVFKSRARITYSLYCPKKNVKEVCLRLLNQDITYLCALKL